MPSLDRRPRVRRWAAALAALAALLGARSALAQPQVDNALPSPRLLTLTPCGGQKGTTVEVTFTGLDLENPDQLRFSHPGIKAEAVPAPEPPPPDPKDPKKPVPPSPGVTKFKVA